MKAKSYDIIIIGCGSAGLTIGLFMVQTGLKVLMISPSDEAIGGDCLNDGCVPSKAMIYTAKMIHNARQSQKYGLKVEGQADMASITAYIKNQQELIRDHENAGWLEAQGIDVVLGMAHFSGPHIVEVSGQSFRAKKIVIATGCRPKKLNVPGVDKVVYYDSNNIFRLPRLPQRMLVIGGGPVGIEIAQTMNRLGSTVTVVHHSANILPHDDSSMTSILKEQLEKEGLRFLLNAEVESFPAAGEAQVRHSDGAITQVPLDAIFVAVGRQPNIEKLQLSKAGIDTDEKGIIHNAYLRTTNKRVFVAGDIAGDLLFSHAAEYHARILLNNFFSPLKKKLTNRHMSWVTFTDPEIATFGWSEKQLREKGIRYQRLEQDFEEDDRAVVDNYQYGKMILYVSAHGFLKKQQLLGGTMVAPAAGELIQELILANASGLSIDTIFRKIYPYPVAGRINQKIIVAHKQQLLTGTVKKILRLIFKIFP